MPASAGVDDGTAEAVAWHLRALDTDFADPDDSGREGHRWPASGLTHDDRRRLAIVTNLSGVPTTELLHMAVGLLFAQTRDAMRAVVAFCREAGISLEEVLESNSLRALRQASPISVPPAAPPVLASMSQCTLSHRPLAAAYTADVESGAEPQDIAAEDPSPPPVRPETPVRTQQSLF